MVGRERELKALERALGAAQTRKRRVVLLAGEPGIGKTRLAAALAALAHDRGHPVLYGRADQELAIPYQAFVEALDSYVDRAGPGALFGLGGAAREQLRRLLPALVGGVARDSGLTDSDEQRYGLYSAVCAMIENTASDRAAVLVLDDLHWAGSDTLLLLRHVVQSGTGTPLLVVATYRHTELEDGSPLARLLVELHREGAELLELGGLLESDVARLLADRDARAVEGIARRVRHQSGGNPFFVGELLRSLAEESGDRAEVPRGVRSVIASRAERLGGPARAILAHAAVIGQEFDVDLLSRVVDASGDEIADALDRAIAAALVTEGGAPGRFAFVHALVPQALCEHLGPARRRGVHRRVAEVLEQLSAGEPGARAGELARHWIEAAEPGDGPRVRDYARAAGERALAALAPDEAVRWLRKALEHSSADGPDRRQLLALLGFAQRQAGDASFRTTLLEAAALARRAGDTDALAQAALAASRGFYSRLGELDHELVEILEAAVAMTGDARPATRARLLATLASELTFGGDWDRRRALSDEALTLARALNDPATLSHVLNMRFVTIWTPETLDERMANAVEGLELAERLGDPIGRFHAYQWRWTACSQTGDLAGALAAHAEEEKIARSLNQPTLRWTAAYDRANLEGLAGRLAESEAAAEEARRLGGETRQFEADAFYVLQMVVIRFEQGRLAEMQPLAAGIVAENATPVFRAILALACCESGLDAEARRMLSAAAADRFASVPWDAAWATTMVIWAQACAHLGDVDAAETLYRLLLPWEDQVVSTGVGAWGITGRYLGLLAVALGRFDDAERHLRVALERHVGMGAPLWAERTRLDLARAWLLRDAPGDRLAASGLLHETIANARERGAEALERRAADLLDLTQAASEMRLPAAAPPSRRPAAVPPAPEPAVVRREQVFRREGEYWAIGSPELPLRLRATKGFAHLATLLENPGIDFLALDLVTGFAAARPAPPGVAGHGIRARSHRADHAGELLDLQARDAYKLRLDDLRDELEEAEAWGDRERAERARSEIDAIAVELAGAVGLRGRDRRAASTAERARVNATRTIRLAIQKIAEHDPALGRHLERSVHTGAFCRYQPEAEDAVRWTFGG